MTNNMRRIPLILMLGPQASGKSSFIKMNDLQNYTISADEIRIRLNGINSNNGHPQINFVGQTEKIVWQIFNQILQTRLQNGLPTIVDNTNLGGHGFNPINDILKRVPNNYQVYVIDCFKPLLDANDPLSEESLAHALKILDQRNRDREYSVNMDIIQRFVDYYAHFEIPNNVKVISSADLQKVQDLIDLILNFNR